MRLLLFFFFRAPGKRRTPSLETLYRNPLETTPFRGPRGLRKRPSKLEEDGQNRLKQYGFEGSSPFYGFEGGTFQTSLDLPPGKARLVGSSPGESDSRCPFFSNGLDFWVFRLWWVPQRVAGKGTREHRNPFLEVPNLEKQCVIKSLVVGCAGPKHINPRRKLARACDGGNNAMSQQADKCAFPYGQLERGSSTAKGFLCFVQAFNKT